LVIGLSTLSPALHLSHARTLRRCRNVALLVTAISVVWATSLNPYSKLRPKRLFLQHTLRKFEGGVGALNGNSEELRHDSGIWVNSMDFLGMQSLTDSSLRHMGLDIVPGIE
jgi:hypothetical protein